MCRMDDLDDVIKNDNGTTFRRPNWVVAVAEYLQIISKSTPSSAPCRNDLGAQLFCNCCINTGLFFGNVMILIYASTDCALFPIPLVCLQYLIAE